MLVPTGLDRVDFANDRVKARRRLREYALVWVRWITVAFLLGVSATVDARSQLFIALLAAFLVIGNVATCLTLRGDTPMLWLLRVRAWVTGIEWLVGLDVLLTIGHQLAVTTTVATLVLILPTVIRFRIAGVFVATVASIMMIAIWTGVHLFLVDALPTERVLRLTVQWLVALPVAVMAVGVLIHFARRRQRWEKLRNQAELAARQQSHQQELGQWKQTAAQLEARLKGYQRQECGLTEREWEVLQLLPDSDLRYEQIGRLLCISEETVKSHVHHIGGKLGVTSRWRIVTAARARDLFGDDTPIRPNRNENSTEGLQVIPPPGNSD